MKRILLLCTLIVSLYSSAQNIQDSFFGLKIGTKADGTIIKKAMEGRLHTDLVIDESYMLTIYGAKNVDFGGVTWDLTMFGTYFKEHLFGSIVFTKTSSNQKKIAEEMEDLKKALTDKYGTPQPTKEETGFRWKGKNGIVLKLVIEEESTMIGGKVQRLRLSYADIDINERYQKIIDAEL